MSRALRNDPRVSEATRLRVQAAAGELGYVPNVTARNLVLRETRMVGMVVTDMRNLYYPNLIAPFHEELAAHGYRMVLFTEQVAGEQAPLLLQSLVDRGVDGAVLVTPTLDSPLPGELARQKLPFVYLTREAEGVAADAVVIDDALGASLVAAEIVRLGHRRIGAIFGPTNTSTGVHRERGFRAGLRAAGIELPDEVVRRGEYVDATGFSAMQELMALDSPPTVVACCSDLVAVGVVNAARALGLRVPEDVSVTGWDDLPLAAWETFRLTTVHVPMNDMAHAAARLLVERIEASAAPPPRRVLFEPRLVPRATLAPPSPAGDGSAPPARPRRPSRGR